MTQISRISLLLTVLLALTGCAGMLQKHSAGDARLLIPLQINDEIGGPQDVNYLLFIRDADGNESTVNLYPYSSNPWIAVTELKQGTYTITDWAMRETPDTPDNFHFSSGKHMFDMQVTLQAGKTTVFNKVLVIHRYRDGNIEKTSPSWTDLTSAQIEPIVSGYEGHKSALPFADPLVTGEYHERPESEKEKHSITINF